MHRSYWLREVEGDALDQPALTGAERADVAIIGGGFVGLWTAIRLKERDPALDVVILERDICGAGASGRNGGEVLSWWAKAGSLVGLCGRDEAIRIARASQRAVAEIGEFCAEHDIDAQYANDGYLWTATTQAQLGAWDSTITLLDELGAPAYQLVSREEVARRTGSDVHLAGVFDPGAATLQPARLVRGLRRVALERGVRIYEHSPVRRIDRGTPPALRTERGVVAAERVVIAMNAWAASLRELHTRIVVVTSDIVLTAAVPERLREIGWDSYEAISDSQIMIHYYRRTREGRVMFGKGGWGIAVAGRLGPRFDRHPGRARLVTENFHRIYPKLADVPIDYDWCGPIDRSYHGLPIFGHLGGHPRIVYGVGWSGNGVGPSVLGGRILASLALGIDDEWTTSPFVGERPGRFPPDPVRYAGAHLVRNAIVRMERAQAVGASTHRVDRFLAGFAPAGIIPKKGAAH